jgi:hypothetical protein
MLYQANHDPDGYVRVLNTADSFLLTSSVNQVNHFPLFSSSSLSVPRNTPFHSKRKTKYLYRRGDKVTFPYGAHDDETLLAEYGFVLASGANRYNTVDVTADVERLIGSERVAILENHGYKGRVYYIITGFMSQSLTFFLFFSPFEVATSLNATRRQVLRTT